MQDSHVKSAPGIVRMKCMIWEPTPMCDRRKQHDAFVFNEITLSHIPTVPKGVFEFVEDPPSFYLKPKHVYRDTFLQVSGENLDTKQDKFRTTRLEPIFENNKFTKPWMYHQTFDLIGSVFNFKRLKPSEYAKGDVDATGLAKFQYGFASVPPADPGVPWIQDAEVSEFDIKARPASIGDYNQNLQPTDAGYDAVKSSEFNFWEERQGWRIFPTQMRVSTESYATSGTTSSTQHKSIHWLVEKSEPVFNKQDFWVEFIKQAYAPDISPSNIPIAIDPDKSTASKPVYNKNHPYKYLDPTYPAESPNNQDGERAIIVNECICEIDDNGFPKLDPNAPASISRQPYYMVEIGHFDDNHRYVILLAYNHYPMFIHIGDVPVISYGAVAQNPLDTAAEADGFAQSVTSSTPVLIQPGTPVSRTLSVYGRSCKELMAAESLRITVRNHLGSIIVYFNDDIENPWVISRSDFSLEDVSPAATIGEMPKKPVYMRVPAGTIRIGAGNILCGFMYGPLHYVETARIAMPDSICVKGPVEDNEVSCYLRESENRTIQGKKKVPRYFQEAEVYQEVINGAPKGQFHIKTIDPAIVKGKEPEIFREIAYNTDKTISRTWLGNVDQGYPRSDEGKYSCLRIRKTTPLSTVANPTGGDSGSGNSGTEASGGSGSAGGQGTIRTETVKFFRAEYSLTAGDVAVGKNDPLKKWIIPNCITPVATGWNLYVPKSPIPRWVCPVFDAAHHVLNFTSSWNFTDMVKVEHSGTIRFLMNFGEMTGTDSNAENTETVFGCPPQPEEPYKVDRSKELAALVDKTFMVRIYAWWEKGYMACTNDECWCKRDIAPNGSNARSDNKSVIFTGLCHGGQVTVEAGKRILECQLLDYWKILEDQQWLNSPFFDGMRDFNAVREVLDAAGFCDVNSAGGQDKWAPGNFVTRAAETTTGIIPSFADANGEVFWLQDYALPSSFDVLQSPILRFNDGDKMDEAITRFARFSGKMVYFDRYGVFKMTPRPDQFFCARGHPMFLPKCNFFASPRDIPSGACTGFDAIGLTNYSYKRGVADTINEIHIVSTTPNGELLIGSGVNLPAKTNPSTPGYAGYTKRLLQVDGIFGSLEAVQNVVKYYSGFYVPPVIVNWESMGTSRLMAGDTVTFTGINLDDAFPPKTRADLASLPNKTTTVYITSLSTEIDPSRNTWTNKYEGEWIFTGQLECNANQKG